MTKDSDKSKVFVFDTTLRDAEQTPGATLTIPDKFKIAQQLARLNVDIIEAGFPVSSNEDFEAVKRIAHEVEGPRICALARAVALDINRGCDALEGGISTRLHTFVGTSPNHQQMMNKTPEQVLKMAVDAVELARSRCDDVEFSPMDATRTDPTYLNEVVEATIAAGARTINIPDTVGYGVPEQIGELIRGIMENVPNVDEAIIAVHCHDDLGMAVSNTLSALKAGARQVECTINGLGERAGNAALEEVVMALATREDYYHLYTDVIAKEIISTSRLVSRLMGIAVAPNKAIVGANAFAHSSGIHQDGVLKNRSNFEIMSPRDVGLDDTAIVLTARSGRHALSFRLQELGHHLSQEELNKAYDRFIEVADKKKEVFDEDLMAIVGDEIRDAPARYKLDYLHTVSGSSTVPSATVRIAIEGEETVQQSASGDGPVDATYEAIDLAIGSRSTVSVDEYIIQSITAGSQAMGEVTVRISENDKKATGRGASTDVIEASAKAYIDALNRMHVLKGRQAAPKQQAV
jgi:2-isopropylmalate synthase